LRIENVNSPRQKWPVKRANPTGLIRFAIPILMVIIWVVMAYE
jgi:hypothetical protein